MIHFKERIENNDFMLNIFEILKKQFRRSKKVNTKLNVASPNSTTMVGDPMVPHHQDTSILKATTFNSAMEEIARANVYATRIFELLRSFRKSDYLIADDFVGLISAVEATKFFKMLTLDQSVNLNQSEFQLAIGNIYQEKEDIIKSISDHAIILIELNSILRGIFILIWIIIVLEKLVVIISAFALIFGFLFESTLKALVRSIIFVIITHPFDIGDYVRISSVICFICPLHL